MAMLPEGWSAHDLGDLAQKIEGGGTPPRNEPSYWDGDIPWASVKDLRGVKLSTTEESISELGLKNSSSKLIPSNTMIIASRMAVGKAVFFNRDVAINQDLKAFYPNKNTDGLFLLQWYLSQSEKIESLATGSTVKGIRLDDLTLLPIDLPPLPEQQKIATILSSVDDVIEKTRAQIDKLKDLKTGMMQELLTKGIGHTEFKDSSIGLIPEGWEVRKLQEIGECVRGLTYSPDNVVENGLLVLRSSNIQNDSLCFKDNVYVNVSVGDKFKLHAGDILICVRNGSKSLIGKSATIPCSMNATHGAFMTVFRTQQYKYVQHLMKSQLFFTHVSRDIGATINSINNSNLLQYEFPIPPIDEQEKIDAILSSVNHKISVKNKLLAAIEHQKKALMQDLLTGKVRVNLTDKESAVV